MSRGYPSMMALLGLLAVAGYQNRDKIAEMLGGRGQGGPGSSGGTPGGAGGLGGALSGALGGGAAGGGLGGLIGSLTGGGATSAGGLLSGGLRDLVEQFQQNGQGDVAQSWVSSGPNKDVSPQQLEQGIGPDVLNRLSEQTGLSREEILARLSRELPKAVDQYTPNGRIPTEDEAERS